jgi:hypothetical protein
MKKMQSSALQVSQSLSTVFDNFFEAMDASALSNAEKEAERASIFEEMRDQLKDGIKVENTGGGGNDVSSKDGKGLMSKLGGMMGGAAMAAGALLAGVGVGAAGLTYAMGKIEELDTSKIKENVDDLLSMAESDRMTVANVAGVAATMTALGVGLAAFSVGAGASAAIAKFTEGSNWPQEIKDNVTTLLSIGDIPGMGGDAAAVTATLTGLGVGLAAFGIGKAADGVGTAISTFASGDNFAENIKKEVETLLSIDTAGVFETAGLVATLTGLGVGLAAFSVGKGTAGVADAVTKFSGENFAADVKREVETLLSIDTSKGDLGDFVKTMGLLSAGLVAFSTGKGAAGAADALTQFTAGDNFAEDIKSEVNTLLSIGEEASMEKTLAATGALTALGAGLTPLPAPKAVNPAPSAVRAPVAASVFSIDASSPMLNSVLTSLFISSAKLSPAVNCVRASAAPAAPLPVEKATRPALSSPIVFTKSPRSPLEVSIDNSVSTSLLTSAAKFSPENFVTASATPAVPLPTENAAKPTPKPVRVATNPAVSNTPAVSIDNNVSTSFLIFSAKLSPDAKVDIAVPTPSAALPIPNAARPTPRPVNVAVTAAASPPMPGISPIDNSVVTLSFIS